MYINFITRFFFPDDVILLSYFDLYKKNVSVKKNIIIIYLSVATSITCTYRALNLYIHFIRKYINIKSVIKGFFSNKCYTFSYL